MEELTKSIVDAIIEFAKSYPLVWFTLLALILLYRGANWLANFIPQLNILRSKILLPLAKKYRFRILVKSAIKSDIQGHVNLEISKIKKYIPNGWLSEMDIKWVEKEEESTFKDDGKFVVRIRPLEDQNHNFINASYQYIRSSFFPKTQAVIPKPHYEACVLHVCKKVAISRNGETKTIFEDMLMEPMIQKYPKIPYHLEDYENIDKHGFFTGTFLRELHLMAKEARFNSGRGEVTGDTTGMMKHIKDFIEAYQKHRAGEGEMSSSVWTNNGTVSRYAILLVAHPVKAQLGIQAYLNRVKEKLNEGAKRIYVFGANAEKDFAYRVINGIKDSVPNISLVEHYETPFDYRGNEKGIGAVFEIKS